MEVSFLQSLNSTEHELCTEVIKLMEITLVMPASNAVSERTFSALRRMKTWLRKLRGQTFLVKVVSIQLQNSTVAF